MKPCAKCGRSHPLEHYRVTTRNPNTGRVYRVSYCRICESHRARSYRERNPRSQANIHSGRR